MSEPREDWVTRKRRDPAFAASMDAELAKMRGELDCSPGSVLPFDPDAPVHCRQCGSDPRELHRSQLASARLEGRIEGLERALDQWRELYTDARNALEDARSSRRRARPRPRKDPAP